MGSSLHNYTVVEAQNIAIGQAGAKFISDTSEHTGAFVAIAMIEDTVFNALTPSDTSNGYGVGSYNGNSMASETIPQGMTIFGKWTTIDLTSGACIAYIGQMLGLQLQVSSMIVQVARLTRDLWGSINDTWELELREWEDIV